MSTGKKSGLALARCADPHPSDLQMIFTERVIEAAAQAVLGLFGSFAELLSQLFTANAVQFLDADPLLALRDDATTEHVLRQRDLDGKARLHSHPLEPGTPCHTAHPNDLPVLVLLVPVLVLCVMCWCWFWCWCCGWRFCGC